MREATPSGNAGGVGSATALALLVGLGVWPYLRTLGFEPMALDSVYWIVRSAVQSQGWAAWSFGGPHFVGYRPVAALSFSLISVFAGLEPLAYRVFDVALHGLNGVLVYVVARRLAPRLPVWVALFSAGLFLWHPAAEEVVPWLARRHNGLACAFSLLAIRQLLVTAERPGALGLGAAGWLAAALLSNEVAYVTALALPFLAWVRRPARDPRGAWLRLVAPGLVATGAALALRLARIGGVGGYTPEGTGPLRAAQVFLAFWRDLLTSPGGGPAPGEVVGLVLGAGALVVVAGVCLGEARDRPLRCLLAGWLLAAAALLAAQRVWFPRELYALLPVFAWLIAFSLHAVLARDAGALARGVPAGVLVLWLAVLALHSPVLRGPGAERIERWSEQQALLTDMHAALDDLDGPADVLLAIPYREDLLPRNPLRARPGRAGPPRSARIPAVWLSALYADRGLAVLDAVAFAEGPGSSGVVRFARLEGRPALVFPDTERFFAQGAAVRPAGAGETVFLDGLPAAPGRSRWLYLRSAGAGGLHALPSADSPPEADGLP